MPPLRALLVPAAAGIALPLRQVPLAVLEPAEEGEEEMSDVPDSTEQWWHPVFPEEQAEIDRMCPIIEERLEKGLELVIAMVHLVDLGLWPHMIVFRSNGHWRYGARIHHVSHLHAPPVCPANDNTIGGVVRKVIASFREFVWHRQRKLARFADMLPPMENEDQWRHVEALVKFASHGLDVSYAKPERMPVCVCPVCGGVVFEPDPKAYIAVTPITLDMPPLLGHKGCDGKEITQEIITRAGRLYPKLFKHEAPEPVIVEKSAS